MISAERKWSHAPDARDVCKNINSAQLQTFDTTHQSGQNILIDLYRFYRLNASNLFRDPKKHSISDPESFSLLLFIEYISLSPLALFHITQ